MPVDDTGEDKGGSPSPNKIKAHRKKQEKAKRRQGAQDANAHAQLGHMTEHTDLQQHVDSMRDKYQSLCDEHEKMIAEGKKAQQAYIRREVQYKSQITRMKELLGKAVLSRGGDDIGMPKIREVHGEIMKKLEAMQESTKGVIESHEKEMLQVFRSRLFEVEDKVKKSSAKKSADVVGGVPRVWIEKANRLARELDHYKEESIRLDGENERLTKESNRLQAEHKSHLDDLAYLENQMTALKKDNLRLKKDLEEAATVSMRTFLSSSAHSLAHPEEPPPPDSRPTTAMSAAPDSEAEREGQTVRLMEAIQRLRKLIDEERARLREVRTGHVSALASRTELEAFLRDALADVKRQISKHRLEAMDGIQANVQGDIVREERDKVLELLLSQERVISLLYEKTFPVRSALSSYGGPRVLSRAGREPGAESEDGGSLAVTEDALFEMLPEVERSPSGLAGEPSALAYLQDAGWEALGRGGTPSKQTALTARSNESRSAGSPTSSHPD